jgi:hypothetical protein
LLIPLGGRTTYVVGLGALSASDAGAFGFERLCVVGRAHFTVSSAATPRRFSCSATVPMTTR